MDQINLSLTCSFKSDENILIFTTKTTLTKKLKKKTKIQPLLPKSKNQKTKTLKKKSSTLKNPDLTNIAESSFISIFKTNLSKTQLCTNTNLTPQIAGLEKTSLCSFESFWFFKKTLGRSKIFSSTKQWRT